ncbi:hypothetical protein BC827DRAFT_1159076 [Russula dissimulans]|nr:hypothetical protein BC827DRAFT_1159076 [Russula dissimulans]
MARVYSVANSAWASTGPVSSSHPRSVIQTGKASSELSHKRPRYIRSLTSGATRCCRTSRSAVMCSNGGDRIVSVKLSKKDRAREREEIRLMLAHLPSATGPGQWVGAVAFSTARRWRPQSQSIQGNIFNSKTSPIAYREFPMLPSSNKSESRPKHIVIDNANGPWTRRQSRNAQYRGG